MFAWVLVVLMMMVNDKSRQAAGQSGCEWLLDVCTAAAVVGRARSLQSGAAARGVPPSGRLGKPPTSRGCAWRHPLLLLCFLHLHLLHLHSHRLLLLPLLLLGTGLLLLGHIHHV